jgi:hypothetical protein
MSPVYNVESASPKIRVPEPLPLSAKPKRQLSTTSALQRVSKKEVALGVVNCTKSDPEKPTIP